MFLCVILELVSVLQFVLEFAFFHLIFDFFVSAVFFCFDFIEFEREE